MGKFKDLTGLKFGRLTVVERADNDKHGYACWCCRCDCGNEVTVIGNDLKRGHSTSCGCLKKEKLIKRSTTHGMKHTKIFNKWIKIKSRCLNPNCKDYPNYGGRGIEICERWLDFQNFYDDVSQLEHFGEENYTLDRIDNNGNYEPCNVRFADRKTQGRNKRNNHLVEYEGVKMTLAEAAERSGINRSTLWARYKHGDRGDKLFRPVKK